MDRLREALQRLASTVGPMAGSAAARVAGAGGYNCDYDCEHLYTLTAIEAREACANVE